MQRNQKPGPDREAAARSPRSIAGDGRSEPEASPAGPFEPSISGCLTGDLGVPSYEPDGISWLPHPATCPHRAGGPRRRSSVRIGPCTINLSREASEELPEARQIFKTPLESELSGRIRLERSDLASNQGPEGIGVGRDRDVRMVTPPSRSAATCWSFNKK